MYILKQRKFKPKYTFSETLLIILDIKHESGSLFCKSIPKKEFPFKTNSIITSRHSFLIPLKYKDYHLDRKELKGF